MTKKLHQKQFSLPSYSTVYEAEIFALTDAVRQIIESSDELRGKANFYTDSMSALHTLKRTKVTTLMNKDLVSSAIQLHNMRETTFQWVKSHDVSVGNNRADTLAKQAISIGLRRNINMSLSHIKTRINSKIRQTWNERWQKLTNCRQSRLVITFIPNDNNSRYVLGRGRVFCRTAVALLTGHNNLRYHVFLRNNAFEDFSPICRFCCEDLETAHHLLESCVGLARRRNFSPENPKKGPDIADIVHRAEHLGIWSMILGSGSEEGETSYESVLDNE